MKRNKFLLFAGLCMLSVQLFAQKMPEGFAAALKADDATKLVTLLTDKNIDNCYQEVNWPYTLLAQSVRHNAHKCFDLLIEKGADVNKACTGYLPPLMHAAKYGRLDMVKVLLAKGASINYKYDGSYSPASGETALSYAEKNNQKEVADYLRSKGAR